MQDKITRPMLADSKSVTDFTTVRYPVLASPKLDGIRAVMVDGKLVSRKFKAIPNDHIRETLELCLPDGFDGELIASNDVVTVGDLTKLANFQDVTSAVMTKTGKPVFVFNVFDWVCITLSEPFEDRLERASWWVAPHMSCGHPRWAIAIVPHKWVRNVAELDAYEAQCLAKGYEGAMLRDPQGPYKCGRATFKQGWLLKVKRFEDAEAKVVGVEEQMHNANEAKTDELGLTKRSTHKAGKVPAGTLGKFVVVGVKGRFKGITFRIGGGPGLTAERRKKLWNVRDTLLGKLVKYKYQDYGSKDAPRIPQFIGFRDRRDM
jgi:DNA ligase 1